MELRREMRAFIDAIPPKRLAALKPLLADLAELGCAIEDDLTGEELALIAEGGAEYDRNPGVFMTLGEYRKSRGLGPA